MNRWPQIVPDVPGGNAPIPPSGGIQIVNLTQFSLTNGYYSYTFNINESRWIEITNHTRYEFYAQVRSLSSIGPSFILPALSHRAITFPFSITTVIVTAGTILHLGALPTVTINDPNIVGSVGEENYPPSMTLSYCNMPLNITLEKLSPPDMQLNWIQQAVVLGPHLTVRSGDIPSQFAQYVTFKQVYISNPSTSTVHVTFNPASTRLPDALNFGLDLPPGDYVIPGDYDNILVTNGATLGCTLFAACSVRDPVS